MDADLQHPPEAIPTLLAKVRDENVDVGVASRYCESGEADGLNVVRSAISRGTTTAAKALFHRPLATVTDPMSGFFIVRRDALDIDGLHPRGFKILLEILVRHPSLSRAEVAYRFAERTAEESKASLREGFRYLSHLLELRFGEGTMRFARFASVGASGIIVNLLLLTMLTELVGLHYLISVALATQGSSLWNFGLTESWVFGGRSSRRTQRSRLLMFLGVNNTALLVRGPLIFVLTSVLAIHYAVSTLLSLLILSVVRYVVSDSWIWGRKRTLALDAKTFDYSIHGIITVRSEVRLPELEGFLMTEPLDHPSMTVRIGKKSEIRRRGTNTPGSERHLVYDEGFGPFGFAINVAMGDTIDIIASPVLRRSPHVLYTNVVEPILRWTFVKHDYALVHGACIAFGDDAYLITARTDTGKTTTLLRMLDQQRRATDKGAFISDDLTLVSPDGIALTYPKPLTISQHTVAAIKQPLLSRKQRLTLPLQSRLHSRGGRRFALLLAASRLPMATVNAVIQWLVPPPKYHVQQLIPGVKLARQATLSGMFVIERGGQGETSLDGAESLEILMSNCEDAYGFPPYDSIKSFLHQSDGNDLREIERTIISQAISGLPAELIRSTTMDWSDRIPATVAVRGKRAPVEMAREAVSDLQHGLTHVANRVLSPSDAATDTLGVSADA